MISEEPVQNHLNRGDHKSAALHFIQMYREHKESKYLANIATCYYLLGKINSAERLCLRALELSGNSSLDAQLTLGHLYLDKGNRRQAFLLYKRLIYSPSHAIHGYIGLAVLLKRYNKFRASRSILEKIVEIFPNDYRSHLQLGVNEFERGLYSKAWTSFQKSLKINPLNSESWEKAYWCAFALEKYDTALKVARKLVDLQSGPSVHYSLVGHALISLDRPVEACQAYAAASSSNPDDIILYLNSIIPFYRIPQLGSTATQIARSILLATEEVQKQLRNGRKWSLKGDQGLVNFLFYTAYSALNLKPIYYPYRNMLVALAQPMLKESIEKSQSMLAKLEAITTLSESRLSHERKKIRLGLLSGNFYAHSNTQAFQGLIRYLNRDCFETILIHASNTVADAIQMQLNHQADEVVYLSPSLSHSCLVLQSLDLDILFFTDIGMDSYDFVLPALRTCPIQITGWGLPHTTGLESIDFYLSSSMLETPQHQEEYVEKLVLLDGLPCCYLSEALHYQKRPKQYFMIPEDRVIIGCVQTLVKIHPDLDLIIEAIARRMPDVLFAFVSYNDSLDLPFFNRLAKRAPTAFQRTLLLERCAPTDFLALCDCIDILLDTPYYGSGVTAYMSAYVGTPTVCFKGARLRDATMAAIYRYLGIANAPIVDSIQDYIDKVVELASDFDLRFKIKKDTVDSAHRLYDNQTYIRSFENFCCDLLGFPRP